MIYCYRLIKSYSYILYNIHIIYVILLYIIIVYNYAILCNILDIGDSWWLIWSLLLHSGIVASSWASHGVGAVIHTADVVWAQHVACHPRPIHRGFNGIHRDALPGKARRYCAEQKELLGQGAHDAFVSSRICTLPATQGKHLSTAKDAILLTCLACLPLFMNAGPCWAQIPVLP